MTPADTVPHSSRRTALAVLLTATAAACALMPATAVAAPGAPSTSGRVIVTPAEGAAVAPIRQDVREAVDATASDLEALPAPAAGEPAPVVVEPGETGLGVEAEARRLRALPGVADARPEALYHLAADPLVTDAAPGTWGLFDTRATTAWATSTGSAAAPVAVVDDGVDFTNPDLAARRWQGADGSTGVDVVAGDGDPAPDGGWHGTHVAGIVGASADGQGTTGVAPNTSIMGVRACAPDGSCRAGDIVRGLVWAVDHGARTVNMSVAGSFEDPYLTQAIAARPHALFVVAAGNEGRDLGAAPSWPCAVPTANVVCVGATERGGAPAGFSNRGGAVDVVAPGARVLSTLPGGTGSASGTSMAAPHVSGTAALVAAVTPGLDGAAMADVLRRSARATAAGPSVDAVSALAAARGGAAPVAQPAAQRAKAAAPVAAKVLRVRRVGSRVEVRIRCAAAGKATVALGRRGARTAARGAKRGVTCAKSLVAKARLKRPASRSRKATLLLASAQAAPARLAVTLPAQASARSRKR